MPALIQRVMEPDMVLSGKLHIVMLLRLVVRWVTVEDRTRIIHILNKLYRVLVFNDYTLQALTGIHNEFEKGTDVHRFDRKR